MVPEGEKRYPYFWRALVVHDCSDGEVTEALELEQPPVTVAGNIEKRSMPTRKRVQMNGCECGEDEDRMEESTSRCNTLGCENNYERVDYKTWLVKGTERKEKKNSQKINH